ncbi:MAG: septal ring lytic transglycosylase RlpA family protein [bacterium]|nr:septal ring lytic transglycosylase RlpA family protein [bacterium]
MVNPLTYKIFAAAAVIVVIALFSGCNRRYEGTYVTPRNGYGGIEKSGGSSVKLTGKTEVGTASYYGKGFHGKPTANGETFDMYALTAAHKTLPFGTKVKVTRVSNGASVVVRINDRGPFVAGRIIDLSYAAAKKLDMLDDGVIKVKIEIVE